MVVGSAVVNGSLLLASHTNILHYALPELILAC